MPADKAEVDCDVAVLGGGLAGLAVATSLARRGLAVVCIEPRPEPGVSVGESLDWSSPQLLLELGFDPERLLGARLGTRKRHVRIEPDDGPPFELEPDAWFARPPLCLPLLTLHLDRGRFDQALLAEAQRVGVRLRPERVTRVHVEADRVIAVETRSARVRAKRYVDASGRARLLGKAFSIEAVEYGEPKVSAWTYLPARLRSEGTTLYLDGSRGELRWIWEIPVADDLQSVGLTLPARALKHELGRTADVERVLRLELERRERFRPLLAEAPALEVHTRSFQCFVHRTTSGPNWFLVGEAAAMIDPLASNGFTFALRFGAHAAELIAASLGRAAIPRLERRTYDACLQRMAHAFNGHIERSAYGPILRDAFGIHRAARVYVVFGYLANAGYQRIRPRGFFSSQLLRALLAGFRLWQAAWILPARFRPGVPSQSRLAPLRIPREPGATAADGPGPLDRPDSALPRRLQPTGSRGIRAH